MPAIAGIAAAMGLMVAVDGVAAFAGMARACMVPTVTVRSAARTARGSLEEHRDGRGVTRLCRPRPGG